MLKSACLFTLNYKKEIMWTIFPRLDSKSASCLNAGLIFAKRITRIAQTPITQSLKQHTKNFGLKFLLWELSFGDQNLRCEENLFIPKSRWEDE